MIGRRRAGRRLTALTGATAGRRRWADLLLTRPRPVTAAAIGLAGLAGLLAGGPVGAVIAAVYAGLGIRALLRRERRRGDARAEETALDAVVALGAGLRAGQPAATALAALTTVTRGNAPLVRIIRARVAAAAQVAEAAGAPLADLLDRLDADLRSHRAVADLGAAHAAGTSATAWLLTALPVAGIGLGYGLGVDPLHQLLHTPLGAGCAGLALILQVSGLAWASRIAGTRTGWVS